MPWVKGSEIRLFLERLRDGRNAFHREKKRATRHFIATIKSSYLKELLPGFPPSLEDKG